MPYAFPISWSEKGTQNTKNTSKMTVTTKLIGTFTTDPKGNLHHQNVESNLMKLDDGSETFSHDAVPEAIYYRGQWFRRVQPIVASQFDCQWAEGLVDQGLDPVFASPSEQMKGNGPTETKSGGPMPGTEGSGNE